MNTVMGIPEREFAAMWVANLWMTMTRTAKGYHHPTLKNLPPRGAAKWRGERRTDKAGTTKLSRRLALKVQI